MSQAYHGCYRCGREFQPDDRFCGGCGSSLEVSRCPACGRKLAPGSAFCGHCGVAVADASSSAQQPPEEQLRQVTVVFALLTGLQSIIEQTDPEEFKDLLDRCFRLLTAEVTARGGTIDKYMADSLLALFGVPTAHEDDPARAVMSALAMLEGMEAFNQYLFDSKGIRLGLKIGINTGKVLMGYVGADRHAITVMGDVVNTASRVEQAAPEGAVLICESTRRSLGEQFRLRAQPPLLVKGKSQPLTVYRVLRQREGAAETGLDTSHLPMVGREAEFDRLAFCWRQVVRPGQGREAGRDVPGMWLTVLGDIGMGKERLLREFQQYIERDPSHPQVVVTRATSLGAGQPHVLRQLLGALTGVLHTDEPRLDSEKLLELAHSIAGPDAETGEVIRPELVVESLKWLVGLTTEGSTTRGSERRVRSLRQQGIAYLKSICARMAASRPLLLVARDLQWAEDAALDFFEALGTDTPSQLLLLTSARPGLLDRRPGWNRRSPNHLSIQLEPLSLRDTQSLVRAMVGDGEPIPPGLVDSLQRFTGGNPLYLCETLKHFLESRQRGLEGSAAEFAVPDSIEGVIQSRLDRLPFEELLTLRAASVVGSVFWRSAVEAILESSRGDALEQLCRRGMIQRRGRSSIPEEEEYSFDHALTARVASGNLLERVRRRYQLSAGEWLAARVMAGEPLEFEAAQHLEQAGEAGRAAVLYAMAGDRALAAYELGLAISRLDKALKNLEEAPNTISSAERGRWLAQRGEARRMRAELKNALDDFQAAAAFALEGGDLVGAASAWYRAGLVYLALGIHTTAARAAANGDQLLPAEAEPAVAAVGLQLSAELLMHQGELTQARQRLEQALVLWRRIGDRWSMAQGLNTLGRIQLRNRELVASHQAFRECAALRDLLGDLHGLAVTLHNLGMVTLKKGAYAEALGHYHRSVRLHRRMDNKAGLAASLVNQGAAYFQCGYYGRSLAALLEAYELNRQLERPWWIYAAQSNLGLLYYHVGRYREALDALRQALQGFEGLQDEVQTAACWLDLADVHRALGELTEAETFAQKAFSSPVRGEEAIEARAILCLARLALERGALQNTSAYLEELEWSGTLLESELQVERAELSGHLLMAEGRLGLAAERFEEAEGIARDNGMVRYQWRAALVREAALKQMGQSGSAARRVADEAYMELLARIEDPTLVKQLQSSIPLNQRPMTP